MKKRIITPAAALFAVLCAALILQSCSAKKEWTQDSLRITLKGGTALVSGEGVPGDLLSIVTEKTGGKKTPVIREVVLGEGITGVNETTFRGLDKLRKIEVEEGSPCLSAEDGILFNKEKTVLLYYPPARSGASYAVPEGVGEIGSAAFADNSRLRKVSLPAGLERIGGRAFSSCGKLEELAFPEGLTHIADGAFTDCAALAAVSLPESLSSIGEDAFRGCVSLTAVRIPSGLKKLGECAFRGCLGVTAYTVAEGNTVFSSADGVLLKSGGKVLVQYPCKDPRSVCTVPEGVTEIGYAAFEGAALTEVAFPDSLTGIGAAAFKSCAALTRVAMPDHVRVIGEAAFSGCAALKEVTLAKYLESIGIEAFFNCPELKTVEVPFKVSFVGFRSLGFNELFGSKKYTEGFTLRCREGSRAQAYAEQYGVAYELVEE